MIFFERNYINGKTVDEIYLSNKYNKYFKEDS